MSKRKADKHANKVVSVSLPGRPGQNRLTGAQAIAFARQLASQNQWPAVIVLLRQVLQQQAQLDDAWHLLFDGLREAGDYPEMERAARLCLEQKPRSVPALLALSFALRVQLKHDDALTAIDKAIKLAPADASAHNHRGVILKETGDTEQALTSFNRSIKLAPKSGQAYWNRADLIAEYSDEEIATMESLLKQALSPDNQIRIHYALSRAYATRRQYEAEFRHVQRGAEIKRQRIRENDEYDHAAEIGQINEIVARFTLDQRASGTTPTHCPVFICGLPRSGTTLAEQILSSHPLVTAGDELNALPRATAEQLRQQGINQPFPEWVDDMGEEQWLAIGARYLDMTKALHTTPFFTDKNLQNYKAIGLIRRAIPGAKIIFCRRQPMDNLWGCYRQYFANGLRFTYSQEELADHYHGAMTLLKHWQSQLGNELFLLDYETLLADQAGTTRKLLDYIGLPWAEECLHFYRNTRSVRTTSASQVRSPLNPQRVGQWQPFASELIPMRQRLLELGEETERIA